MRIVERVPSVRSTSMDRQSRDRDPDSTNQPELFARMTTCSDAGLRGNRRVTGSEARKRKLAYGLLVRQMVEKTRAEAFLTKNLATAELGSPQSRAAARAV